MNLNRNQIYRRILICIALLCISTFSQLPAAEPDENRAFEEAKLLWKKGYYMHSIGRYEKAISLFSRSIELHPSAEAYTFRGWSFSMLGRIEEAIAECKLAIELDPEYGNPYNDIGVYLIDLGRPEDAIPWLKKATQAKRYCCYQYPHFNLGRVLLMQGRVTEAKESLSRSLAYDPDYLPAKILLESIHEMGLEPIQGSKDASEDLCLMVMLQRGERKSCAWVARRFGFIIRVHPPAEGSSVAIQALRAVMGAQN